MNGYDEQIRTKLYMTANGRQVVNSVVDEFGYTSELVSYKKVVAKVNYSGGIVRVYVDKDNYRFSRTTNKYVCKFLDVDSDVLEVMILKGIVDFL